MQKLYVLLMLLMPVMAIGQTQVEITDIMFSEYWFDDLDEALKQPDKVKYLDLSLQKRREFPVEVFQFKNLTHLYLPYNYFREIPEEIGNMTQLEELDLSGTYYLNHIPESIGKLQNLKVLKIKDNRLAPGEIDKLRKLLPNCEIITD